MKNIIAAGREVSINGRRYLAGDELPELPVHVIDALRSQDIIKPEYNRVAEVEKIEERRAERKGIK